MKGNENHPMNAIFRNAKRPDSKAIEDRLLDRSDSSRERTDEREGGVDKSGDEPRPPVGKIDQGPRGKVALPAGMLDATRRPKTLSQAVLRALEGRRAEEPLDFGP